jgi:putative transcriptional regulator
MKPISDISGSLKDHLLIATPALKEGFFAGSVTYLCEHTEQGAMGIVINLPLDVPLGEVLDNMELEGPEDFADIPVLAGGPVEIQHGFVLHSGADTWDSTLRVTDNLGLTTSKDILRAIAQSKGPTHYLVALGYAGWTAGQLEDELKENAWLAVPADLDLIFTVPFEQKLTAAADKLGLDIHLLTQDMGHA